MRLLVYNIRYATGTGWDYHLPVPYTGYLRPTDVHLKEIIQFLHGERADIVGLIEVDSGSYRTGQRNQAERIAKALGYTHVYESKYGQTSLIRHLPLMRDQGNAFLTNQDIEAQGFHYFTEGVKRLVIELELENFVIFLVHLSLRFRHRQYQLGDLHALFKKVEKPKIVAGDFNAFAGQRELDLFLSATGLENANSTGLRTFPSHDPKRELDFILHSSEIRVVDFRVPGVRLSDHMPIVMDFDLQ